MQVLVIDKQKKDLKGKEFANYVLQRALCKTKQPFVLRLDYNCFSPHDIRIHNQKIGWKHCLQYAKDKQQRETVVLAAHEQFSDYE